MNGKRLVLAIGIVAFVVIASVVIFSINWGGSAPAVTLRGLVNISDYADTDTKVRMTIRGPVNSNQEHQDLQITVGRDITVGELIGGYQGNVSRSQVTRGNVESYRTFLSALHNAQFTDAQLPPRGLQYDGACSNGKRYTFEFLDGEDTPPSLWATTCSKKDGNFGGETTVVRNLFFDQIPEDQWDALTADSEF